MLKTAYLSEETMEDLAESLDDFFHEHDIEDEDLIDIQYNFRRCEAMIIYTDDDD